MLWRGLPARRAPRASRSPSSHCRLPRRAWEPVSGSSTTRRNGLLERNPYRRLQRFFHVLLSAILLCTSLSSTEYLDDRPGTGEMYALMLFGTAGMMLMTSAASLLLVFIGLEISSISSYVMTGFRKQTATGPEAALKYFLLGSFATAFFLYGVALAFGATGSDNIYAIGQVLSSVHSQLAPFPRSPTSVSPSCSSASASRFRPRRSRSGRRTSTKARPRPSPASCPPAPRPQPSPCCCASCWSPSPR